QRFRPVLSAPSPSHCKPVQRGPADRERGLGAASVLRRFCSSALISQAQAPQFTLFLVAGPNRSATQQGTKMTDHLQRAPDGQRSNRLLRPKEAADFLGVSRAWLARS